MSGLPLAGIRVVDFTWVGAGSYATRLLADHGADVIKIESMAKIDGIRLSPPFAGGEPGPNRSGYFADRNSSKRSCAINMKTERGREIAGALVERSQLVANNFTPGVMERFGLGWEQVRELNPSIVYLAMSMQGSTGPERDSLGYGLTIGAIAGLHALTGLPGRSPVGTGTNYPDHIPNPTHATFALLAALRHARRTGVGQFVDVSQVEATVSVLGAEMLRYTVTGDDPQPRGNTHEVFSPHGLYRCRGDDRWIAIAVTNQSEFGALLTTLGLGSAEVSPEMDLAQRRAQAARIDSVIESVTVGEQHQELATRLQRAGVPAAPVHDARGVVEDDAQLAARNHWVHLAHVEMGETIYGAAPFRFSTTPAELTVPAPLLGEHTGEVCREVLGMDDSEIGDLVAAGVLE